jgi:PhnB protein
MSIKQVNPYLHFDGRAEEAIKLYEEALGARTENVMRYGDQAPRDQQNRVMHAVIHIGAGVVMASDPPPGVPVAKESNMEVSLDFDDANDMTKKFAALSDGGRISMPLTDTPWGGKIGMLTDAFGIRWLFNCDKK